MGASAFAGLLGHAASGFEAAQQEDLQRQFIDEQNRRQSAGEFLRTLAMDPNQSDQLRQMTGNAYLELLQNPGKKLNFKQTFEPIFNIAAQTSAAQRAYQQKLANQPPPIPATQFSMPPAPNANAATVTPGLPGVGTNTQLTPPQINAPLHQLALANPQVNPPSPGPPPPGMYAGPQQIAEHEALGASAVAGGTLSGQMEVR